MASSIGQIAIRDANGDSQDVKCFLRNDGDYEQFTRRQMATSWAQTAVGSISTSATSILAANINRV